MFRKSGNIFLFLFLSLLFVAHPLSAEPVAVQSTPVALNEEDPDQKTAGRLIYRGGLHLISDDDRFGGFSGLLVSEDGNRLVALTDRGARLYANLQYDGKGTLTGLDNIDMGALAGPDGRPLQGKEWSDAEALAPGTLGEIIIAFERRHRIWGYEANSPLPFDLHQPDELSAAPKNKGIEALALLPDQRLFALTEGFGDPMGVLGWVSHEEGWSVLTYELDGGFQPTGAATLPSGDVIVIERLNSVRENWAARLKVISGRTIQPGASLKGETIAELRPPLNVDNFEAVSAIKGQNGETLIYILSDDNFRPQQRTLLMMFALQE